MPRTPGSLPTPDDEAFATLRRRLVASVARVCPAWLADQAEDLAQTAVLQLLKPRDGRGGKREFSSTYLMKAAHGVVVDEIRRRCRRKEETGSNDEALERVASRVDDPERAAADHEIGRGIGECLTSLRDARRLAVTLYLRGCTVPDAARRLGWTLKRTEHLVYRALNDLRRCLMAKGITP